MPTDYRLRVIRVEDLQWKDARHSKVPNIYVEVKLDGGPTKRTQTIKCSLSPEWNEDLVFLSADESATLLVQVKHESSWLSDPCIGFVNIALVDLMAKCAYGEASLILPSTNNRETLPKGRILLCLQVDDPMAVAASIITETSEDTAEQRIVRGPIEPTDSLNNEELHGAVGQLLARLGTFRSRIDALSELSQIHPFLSVAWSVASSLYKIDGPVLRTDRKLTELVQTLNDAFTFVHDVQSLPNTTTSLQEAISRLLKQTTECCLFVSNYTKRGFLIRSLDSSIEQKTMEFMREVVSLRQQIETGVILHQSFVSMRTQQGLEHNILRQRLEPSSFDAFDRPICYPASCLEIRARIFDWTFTETEQNIFWLYGSAQTGKSVISTTVADEFRSMSRLGAFLFFGRGKSKPSSVIRTIAYKLAQSNSSIGSSILSETERDMDIASAAAHRQFQTLLLKPLRAADEAGSLEGPIAVVIDALDECGTPESRRSLMALFRSEFAKLPNAIRFIIASRKEPDINEVFSSQPETVCVVNLADFAPAEQQGLVSSREAPMELRSQIHPRGLQIQTGDIGTAMTEETGTSVRGEEGVILKAGGSILYDPGTSKIPASDCPGAELFWKITRSSDTSVMEDLRRADCNTLQFAVDVVRFAIDSIESGDSRKLDRFLALVAEKRGILPSNIFLTGVQREGSNFVRGGGFGDVWKGSHGGKVVALKVLRTYCFPDPEKAQLNFAREALLWRKMDHPNVLPLLGICRDVFPSQIALVSEWMEKGNLNEYLCQNSLADCLGLALGVARGLEYLHNLKPQIIHGDLRAANVLIDEHGQPRITDFGLARAIDSKGMHTTTSFKGDGAVRWQAPELLYPSRFSDLPYRLTVETDVYAFACVCFEIFSGRVPFSELHDVAISKEVAELDKRPNWPEEGVSRGLTEDVWHIMQLCWKVHPVDRPKMPLVVSCLEDYDLRRNREAASCPSSD